MNIKRYNLLTLAGLTVTLISQSIELTVKVQEIKGDKGTVIVQLFKGSENYKNAKAEAIKAVPAKTGMGSFNFDNLVAGSYTIRVLHDENNNKKMDTNVFGIPNEGYGFSNEAVGNFGPPKYKDMVFIIAKNDKAITNTVKMIY